MSKIVAGEIGHRLTRKCTFCKQPQKAWRNVPEYCCDAYREAVQSALAKALIPPDPPKPPHPFTGRKGPL